VPAVLLKAAFFVLAFALTAQHLSHSHAVRSWQHREQARMSCSIAVAVGRDDVAERRCR
jgi:hypothetical protein